jgi:hypothetical protein
MPQSPPTLRGAAVVQAAEAVIVLAATVLAGIDAASGLSYHVNSGIALTAIGAGAAVTLAWVAIGLARARRWSRTPALLTQLFVGIVGIYLLQGHRFDWGTASVVLAVLGFAALLSPPSMRALTSGGRAVAAEREAPDRARASARERKPAKAASEPGAAASKPPKAASEPGAAASKPPAAGPGRTPAPSPGSKPPAAGPGREPPPAAPGRTPPARAARGKPPAR